MQKNRLAMLLPFLKKYRYVLAAIPLLLLAISIYVIAQTPERSVAAYCKVLKEQDAKLPKPASSSDRKYVTAGLTSSSDSPVLFAEAFGELERVAPEDIVHDVRNMKMVYEKLHDDPSQAWTTSLSGLSVETKVTKWTQDHCTNQR